MSGKIIEVKQNTKEWRVWRDKGLGASDAPIVMGVSPWITRFQLWGYKTGLLERPEPNVYQAKAMQRGHDLEPQARKIFEDKYAKGSFPATSFEHATYPYLRASLDGYNKESNTNLEIKCPGKVDHALAVSGKVPEKYIPQTQMQMIVSGANTTQYFSWDGEKSEVIIEVKFDIHYASTLLHQMILFWDLVQKKTSPEFEKGEQQKILTDVLKTLTRLQQTVKLLSSLETDFVKVS